MKKTTILILASFILLLPLLPTTTAMVCGGECYSYGYCDGGTWYEGCEVSDGIGGVLEVLGPGAPLGLCAVCECTSPEDCEWIPRNSNCDVCHTCSLEWEDDLEHYGEPNPPYPPLNSNCDEYIFDNLPETCQTHKLGVPNIPHGDEDDYVCGRDTPTSWYAFCTHSFPDEKKYVDAVVPGDPNSCCDDTCLDLTTNQCIGKSACNSLETKYCDPDDPLWKNTIQDRDNDEAYCTDATGCDPLIWEISGMKEPTRQHGGYESGEIDGNTPNCCGDDNQEYHIDSTGIGGGVSCCASPAFCADNDGICRQGTEHWATGDTCRDDIDNDCDGDIDEADDGCQGTLNGRVVFKDTGNPLVNGVEAVTVFTNLPYYGEKSTDTDGDGYYSIGVPITTYDLHVRAATPGYTSDLEHFQIPNFGDTITTDDLELEQQRCNDDCTNSFGFCDESCEGAYPGCDINEVYEGCDGKQKGWRVQKQGDPLTDVLCCDGVTEIANDQEVELTGTMKNLIKNSKLVKYQGQLVELVVLTWETEE